MRTNWRREPVFSWPPSSWPISHVLTFFKGNLFLDISKTHLKAIFKLRLQPLLPLWQPFPPFLLPTVMQSPFLGSQHSFDLILNAICNPLQDTEACSPHMLDLFYRILYLFPLLTLGSTFSFLYAISSPSELSSCPPTWVRPIMPSSYHLRCSDNFIAGAALLLLAIHGRTRNDRCTLLNTKWDCSLLPMLTHRFITKNVWERFFFFKQFIFKLQLHLEIMVSQPQPTKSLTN